MSGVRRERTKDHSLNRSSYAFTWCGKSSSYCGYSIPRQATSHSRWIVSFTELANFNVQTNKRSSVRRLCTKTCQVSPIARLFRGVIMGGLHRVARRSKGMGWLKPPRRHAHRRVAVLPALTDRSAHRHERLKNMRCTLAPKQCFRNRPGAGPTLHEARACRHPKNDQACPTTSSNSGSSHRSNTPGSIPSWPALF